ncbi:hypothetical protein QYF61_016706 [Mycteria americana]|uniref:Endonuclease/exonuclease/phosphatase domain-containing protein n=1 Tax=Mycteria americana TaxID=33587 RepID=A0AAN7MZ25_MYCAM|nr:hypothetical protein QYF61_016706 [Mycteria americana]
MRCDLIALYSFLRRGSGEGGADLFSLVSCGRTPGNGSKLHQGSFRLDIRKHFFMERVVQQWHRLPREVSVCVFLELWAPELDTVFQARPDKRRVEWDDHISVCATMPPVQQSQYETGVSYYFQYTLTAYFAKTPRSVGRPPDQEEQVDEAFYRQLEGSSRLQVLVVMEDFNCSNICWYRDSTAGHRQSRMFLESFSDNFLTQVTEEPKWRGALLDLLLTHKEGLVGNVKAKGSLGCHYHEMVEFRILRGRSRAKSRVTTLDFERAGIGLVKALLEIIPLDKGLVGRRPQEKWLMFKAHVLQAQEQSIPTSSKSGKKCQGACMEEQDALGKTQT